MPFVLRMCRLQYLDLSMASVSPSMLQDILFHCRQLRKVSLENVPINGSILRWEVSALCFLYCISKRRGNVSFHVTPVLHLFFTSCRMCFLTWKVICCFSDLSLSLSIVCNVSGHLFLVHKCVCGDCSVSPQISSWNQSEKFWHLKFCLKLKGLFCVS